MSRRKTVLTEATSKRHKALLLAGVVMLLAGFGLWIAAVTLTRSAALQDGIVLCGTIAVGIGIVTTLAGAVLGWWQHG